MNKRQIKKAYNDGLLDVVALQCRAYGIIQLQHDYGDAVMGFYRNSNILHHGIEWDIELWNGEVIRVGHNAIF